MIALLFIAKFKFVKGFWGKMLLRNSYSYELWQNQMSLLATVIDSFSLNWQATSQSQMKRFKISWNGIKLCTSPSSCLWLFSYSSDRNEPEVKCWCVQANIGHKTNRIDVKMKYTHFSVCYDVITICQHRGALIGQKRLNNFAPKNLFPKQLKQFLCFAYEIAITALTWFSPLKTNQLLKDSESSSWSSTMTNDFF